MESPDQERDNIDLTQPSQWCHLQARDLLRLSHYCAAGQGLSRPHQPELIIRLRPTFSRLHCRTSGRHKRSEGCLIPCPLLS